MPVNSAARSLHRGGMGDAESLPLAHVKRIVKGKLAELTGADEGDKKKEVSVQKEALAALAEAARIFIHFLTGTANELCHESKRLTINADDVLRALEDVEFSEFAEPLREALAGARERTALSALACAVPEPRLTRGRACAARTAFKVANAEKQASKQASKKRKAEGDALTPGAAADEAGAPSPEGAGAGADEEEEEDE